MKKKYIIPETKVVLLHGETILSASGVVGKIGNDDNIGFGGVDEKGELDPEVKGNPYGESIFD